MPTDPDLAPETHNDEQDDEQSQAQTVADQAQQLRKGDPTSSVKHDTTETPDVVDHMRDMEASGRIDMGAYRGEPSMDDDEGKYGEDNDIDPELPSDS
jgi:hypothetical protein